MNLPAMTENELQTNVLALCRYFDLLAYHTHDSRRSAEGFPDLAILGTSLLLAELKNATRKRTAAQDAWAEGLEEAASHEGARVMYRLWRPEHWWSGEIRRTLEGLRFRADLTARPPAELHPHQRRAAYLVASDGVPYGPFDQAPRRPR
jgi:hypothetical protein